MVVVKQASTCANFAQCLQVEERYWPKQIELRSDDTASHEGPYFGEGDLSISCTVKGRYTTCIHSSCNRGGGGRRPHLQVGPFKGTDKSSLVLENTSSEKRRDACSGAGSQNDRTISGCCGSVDAVEQDRECQRCAFAEIPRFGFQALLDQDFAGLVLIRLLVSSLI